MRRIVRTLSPLIATIIIVAITIVIAVAVSGYIFGLYSSHSSTTTVTSLESVMFYTQSCSRPPCAVVALVLKVEPSTVYLYDLNVGGMEVNLDACRYYTTEPRVLDVGRNIIVVVNSNRCLVVSEKRSQYVFNWWYNNILSSLSGTATDGLALLLPLGFHPPSTDYIVIRITTSKGSYMWVASGVFVRT